MALTPEQFNRLMELHNQIGGQKVSQPTTPTPAPQPKQGLLGKIGSSISNAFNSSSEKVDQGFQQAQTATSPVQAVESGLKVGAGAIGAVTSPLAPLFEPINMGVNFIANKVSNSPSFQKFAESKAGQTTARVAGDVGDLSVIAGTGMALGAPKPEVGSTGPGGGDVPPGGGGGGSGPTPFALGASKTLKTLGEKSYGLTIAPEESTSRAMMNYDAKQPNLLGRIKNMTTDESVGTKPITEANTAARHGLVGTEYQLGVQAKQVSSGLWDNIIGPRLDSVKGNINLQSFLDEVGKDINKTKDLTRRGVLKEALDVVKEDYKNVSGIRLRTLQDYKSGWAEFVPEGAYKGKPIGAAIKEVHALMAERARKTIYKYAGDDIKQAYIDYGNLKSIEKAGLKSTLGDPSAKSISRNVWQFVMNKAVTPVATFAGKALYRTGEGLEFVGKPGAKNVGDVVGRRNLIITQKGKGINPVKITRPTRLKVRQEGRGTNKIPLYGGETPPRANLPTINMGESPKVQGVIPKQLARYTKDSVKVVEAFNKSKPIKNVGKFELGSFGENAGKRKSAQIDRFPVEELDNTVGNIKEFYRASDNPSNYRYDNIVWIAEMPDGARRVIYTRLNNRGKEEIINWHKLNKAQEKTYLDTLRKFGAPDQNRTDTLNLED